MESLITLEQATLLSQKEIFFKDFSFDLNKGNHTAIVGADASGKSSLLKCLAGKEMLTSGSIQRPFFEDFYKRHSPEDPFFSFHNIISYVDVRHSFKNLQNQQSHFYQQRYNASFSEDSLTTEEYLLEQEKKKKRKEKWTFTEVVELFDLQPLLSKHLIKLSNGESRRVRIASALIKNPVILFINQPLVGIDIKSREKFNHIFSSITASDITLVISCNENEIPSVITKVIKTNKGDTPHIFDRKEFTPSNHTIESKPDIDPIILNNLIKEHPHFDEIVTMKDVSIKYHDHPILSNINWEIHQGDKWSLSGPNGSGKSTLLSLINGDHPQAYSNDITLFDKKRGTGESIWEIKQKIGFVSPELFQFFPVNVTCKKAIISGLFDTIGFSKKINAHQEKVVVQWMELLQLTHYSEQLFRNLPLSMQRLTLLARAMVKNPPLLILDEPCQGFDSTQQKHFRYILESISEQNNLTWIYVTHHQEQLPGNVSHQMILKANGEVEFMGKMNSNSAI